VQAAAAQTWVIGSQVPEVQSAETAQERPGPHVFPWATQVAPPQSTSVSMPFLKPSAQPGAAQRRVEGLQNPEVQSVGAAQPIPFAHVFAWATQVAPPQSTPVSVPFFSPSVQLGVAHSFEALQKPEVQSVGAAQPIPSAHVFPWATQVAPPQSTPVSLPFFTPSVHVGAVAGGVEVFPPLPLPPQPAIARAIVSASASRLNTGHAKLDMALSPPVNRRKRPREKHWSACLSISRRACCAQEVGAGLTGARPRSDVVLGW
jgi:hypothetical protein